MEEVTNKLYNSEELDRMEGWRDGYAQRDIISNLATQLKDTIRENKRLTATLQYIATGDDTTVDDLHAQHDFYRNKQLDNFYPSEENQVKNRPGKHPIKTMETK